MLSTIHHWNTVLVNWYFSATELFSSVNFQSSFETKIIIFNIITVNHYTVIIFLHEKVNLITYKYYLIWRNMFYNIQLSLDKSELSSKTIEHFTAVYIVVIYFPTNHNHCIIHANCNMIRSRF